MSATLESTLLANKAAAAGDSDYQIEKSLRFNKPDTPSLQQTVGNAGNRRIFTLSAWVKLAAHEHNIILGQWDNTYDGTRLHVDTSGTVRFQSIESNGTAFGCNLHSTRKLRDFSAWYHLCVTVDTTLAVTADRVKIYVNGKRLTSFSTGSYPSKDYQFDWNGTTYTRSIGYWKENNTDYSSAALITEAQHIDGLALSPAAFGKFDSNTGVWNPKAFALPAPNTDSSSPTWSNSLSTTGGALANGGNMFDGVEHTRSTGGSGGTYKFTLTNPITVQSEVEINSWGASGDLVFNPGKYGEKKVVSGASLGSNGDGVAYSFSGDWYGFTFTPSSGEWDSSYIKVDGVTLVDGKTDLATRNNPNNGTKWSDHLAASASGAWSGHPFSQGFNGITTNDTLTDNSGATLTLTFPTAITASKLEIQVFHDTRTNDESTTISGTGITSTTFSGNDNLTNFKEIPLSGSTISTITVAVANQRAGIAGIKIDGQFLIDSADDNSFHLKFNDTSRNNALGKDTLNGKIADATGALPIHNTTDDYGDVKGSGNRTDSDSSNLKLAIGNTATDSSSAGLTVTFNGNAANSTEQSRFYGSSIKLDGDGDNITTSGSPWSANGNATFECWVYKTTGDSEVLWDTTSAGALTILSSGKIELHPVNSNYQESNSTVPQNAWTHIAFTQTSSARRLWINGIESSWGSATGSPQTAAWTGAGNSIRIGSGASQGSFSDLTGYIQDIRIYDKVKYTANFKPPTRNDFTVNNLTHDSGTMYSSGTTSGSLDSGPWSLAFNGTTGATSYVYENTIGTPARLTFPNPITVTGLVRVYASNGSNAVTTTGDDLIRFGYNDGSTSSDLDVGGTLFNNATWHNITGSDSWNTIEWIELEKKDGGQGPCLFAVDMGGTIFVDTGPENQDSLVDTPTNYGTDEGNGGEVRGNYCTMNPLDKGSAVTFAQGNLTISTPSGSADWDNRKTVGTMSMEGGKFYYEQEIVSHNAGVYVGLIEDSPNANASSLGYQPTGYGYYSANGQSYNNGGGTSYGNTFTAGDVISVAFDGTTGKLWFAKNGTWQSSATKAEIVAGTTTNAARYNMPTNCRPAFSGYEQQESNFNFGQRAWKYPNSVPTGFKALCTQNIPDTFSGEDAGTINNPSKYFESITHVGTGATLDVNVGFQPDFVWLKRYDTSKNAGFFTSVGGVNKFSVPSAQDVERDDGSDNLTNFLSDGFRLGADSYYAYFNTSGADMVSYNWLGGTTQANTAGTIDVASGKQSVNTTAGFSVTEFENVANSQTIGHGLSEKPQFIITKNVDNSVHWQIYHEGAGASAKTYLSDGSAAVSSSMWGSGPDNTVFTYDDGTTNTVIAWCWHAIQGYSAFGKYEGSGDTDGPFVYTGFKPRWLLIKAIDTTAHWRLFSSELEVDENPYNYGLYPNLANANETAAEFNTDILASGFKPRGNSIHNVASTLIYAAFAEHPFKLSRAN